MKKATHTPKPIKAAADPAAKKTIRPPHAGLTETQTLYADLAADLLLCGGDPRLFEQFVTILTRHEYLRKSYNLRTQPEAAEANSREYADANWVVRRKAELMKSWPEEIPTVKEPMPAQVREMAAFNMRSQLRDEFEAFMSDADFVDQWVLWDVLNTNASGWNLAESFRYQSHESGIYVRVPESYKERVETFVKMLGKAA